MEKENRKASRWIWSPSWKKENECEPVIMLFRKTIDIKEPIKESSLRISADTRYKLYVNGSFVEMGPSRGDGKIWFYDTVCIAPYLKQGRNILAVSVLRYPKDPEKGNHGMFRTPIPGLYVSGFIRDIKDCRYDLSANASWKCKKDSSVKFVREEPYFSPLYIHENTCGNPATWGWKMQEYDDGKWKQAKPYPKQEIEENISLHNLQSRTIPFLYRRKRQFAGVMDVRKSGYTKEDWIQFLQGKRSLSFPPGCEEIVELDAGEEMTGYMKTRFGGGRGSQVQFLYSEAYVQSETVGPARTPVKTDRMDKVNGHLEGYQDCYRICGLGTIENEEIYEPYWFRTFRFLQLRIVIEQEPLELYGIDYEETGYPIQIGTKVTTSDKSLAEIWDISERTLRRCMHETYEDCPFYEQLQYVMDSRQQILYTYAVSADDRLARKCMDDMRRSQREDGLLNACYPNCNTNVIPGFSIYYILMVYDHMMYFGDKSLVEEQMPVIYRILNYFENHLAQEGYVKKIGGILMEAPFWSFIDWAKEWSDTSGMPPAGLYGPLTMESLLYLYGLSHAQKLAEYVGQKEKVTVLAERAEKVKRAVQKYCIGPDGMIQDGPGVETYSQQCQVFGILTDVLDMENGRKNLLMTIEKKELYAQCTVAMSFYLFRALQKTGLYQYTDQYWDVWRTMIQNHCTTCVESESYARSECHGWGALILYELPSVTLGVVPAEPGYQKVRISPVPGYLRNASGTVKTPRGTIFVSWEWKNDQIHLNFQAPDGVEVVTEENNTPSINECKIEIKNAK